MYEKLFILKKYIVLNKNLLCNLLRIMLCNLLRIMLPIIFGNVKNILIVNFLLRR